MKNLSDTLLELAIEKDLSKPFQKEWKQRGKSDLIEFYKTHSDWCMERNYPSLEFLKENFDTEDIRKQGVYIDRRVNEVLSDQVYMFINCTGYCKVKFDPNKAIFPMIYVSLDSDMHFEIDGSDTPIQTYDNAVVTATAINGGKFKIYNGPNTST